MKESGLVTILGLESGKSELPTKQCVHCGGHWTYGGAIKQVRGFCHRCNGPICGANCYARCVPAEQQIENIEAGRPLDYMPIKQSVVLELN